MASNPPYGTPMLAYSKEEVVRPVTLSGPNTNRFTAIGTVRFRGKITDALYAARRIGGRDYGLVLCIDMIDGEEKMVVLKAEANIECAPFPTDNTTPGNQFFLYDRYTISKQDSTPNIWAQLLADWLEKWEDWGAWGESETVADLELVGKVLVPSQY
ncbi:hypothetical protein LTR17_020946 [Elasticomyces elasticus]|nr:hypothetical protein LTR17_020946 [Elasticomyces elasticus]